MNVRITLHDFMQVLKKYEDFKAILQAVEQGKWKDNPMLQQIPVDRLEHLRFIVDELEKTGLGRIAETRKMSIN